MKNIVRAALFLLFVATQTQAESHENADLGCMFRQAAAIVAVNPRLDPDMIRELSAGGIKLESMVTDIKLLSVDPVKTLLQRGFIEQPVHEGMRPFVLGNADTMQIVVIDRHEITLGSFAARCLQNIVMVSGKVVWNKHSACRPSKLRFNPDLTGRTNSDYNGRVRGVDR